MGYIYYCYLGLLPEASSVTLFDVKQYLAEHYSKHDLPHTLELQADLLQIKLGSYTFDIRYVDGVHVKEESEKMAKYYQGDEPEHQHAIRSATKRLEMSGDDDPEMNFFNDSLIIQQCWEALGIEWIFSPFQGKFTKDG